MTPNLREQSAVISATFADWRTVKSRKTLQLVFEVPLEQQTEVLTMLGAPMPDAQRWCAIALLNTNSPAGSHPPSDKERVFAPDGYTVSNQKPSTKPAGEPSLAKQRYAVMSPAEQAVVRAGRLPQNERFRAWLSARWFRDEDGPINEETAADCLRQICCNHNSRKLIAQVPEYLDRFLQLETEYRMDVGELARPR